VKGTTLPLWRILRSREEFGQSELPLLTVKSADGVGVRNLADGRAPSEDLDGYRVVRAGDLVVNKMWARFGAYGVSSQDGVISPAYWVLRVVEDLIVPRFLHSLLRSPPFRAEVWRRSKDLPPNGFDLPWAQFRLIQIPRLPLAGQHMIADFLDRECERIAEATKAAARTVAVLAQQEREVFERLTLGAPTVALRRRLLRIEQGWSPECEATTAEPGEWGVLKVGCVNHGRFRAGEHKRLPDDLTPRPALEIWSGDLLMSRANTRELVGSAAVVDDVDGRRLMLCDKTFRLITRDDTTPAFLSLALGSRSVRDQIEVDTAGASSSMQNIAQSTIRGLLIPDLPLAEQESIERAVAARAAILGEATRRLAELQDRLAEYRDALITEAVTGQLDVTTVSDARMDEHLHRRADAASA